MENREIQLIIEDIGAHGEGIGRSEGRVVFVPGELPGDEVLARVVEDRGRFLRAELAELTHPSSERVAPLCPHAKSCGGCPLMELSYRAQLAIKEKQVRDALQRLGKIQNPAVRPMLGMENPWHYRNKARFALRGKRFGYLRRGTHELVPVASCPILPDEMVARAAEAAAQLPPGQRAFAHLTVREAAGGALMTILERRDGSTVSDCRVLSDTIETDLGTLKTEISPRSFCQVNPLQCGRLYSLVQEYAAPSGGELLLDLYCGAGSIGLSMAKKLGRLIGVESVGEAVRDAERNAAINGVANAHFLCGRAEEILPTRLQNVRADIVVLDPPRAGCDKGLLEQVARIAAPKLVYVSCNPATLARDLALLLSGGYRFIEAAPVDLFPHTLGIEVVAFLSR